MKTNPETNANGSAEQAVAPRRGAQRGNTSALRHGGYSSNPAVLQVRDDDVDSLVLWAMGSPDNGIEPAAPWLTLADRPAVVEWARATVMAGVFWAYVAKVGVIAGRKDSDLTIRRVVAEAGRWNERSGRWADRLGLVPTSRYAMRVSAYQGDDLATALMKARAERGGLA